MSANYKNFPFRLIGYTLLLFIVARTQSIKAVYPDPSVVEMHWRKNPKIFCETFEALFPKAENLSFWSEKFPNWFGTQGRVLCEVTTNSGDWLFHAFNDLNKLSYDAELKKIIKVLGSTEFLEKVLPKEVVKSIFAHVAGDEKLCLEIAFKPYFKNAFFDPLGKGSIEYALCLSRDGDKEKKNELSWCFMFDFEKEHNVTFLKNCGVSYRAGDDEIKMEFFKKTNKRPNFPWNAPQKAKGNFSSVYAKLRESRKNGRRKYEDFTIFSTAQRAKVSCLEEIVGINRASISSALDILVTEDFLEEIFGREFWNILKQCASASTGKNLNVTFKISEYPGGFKVLFQLYNSHRGHLTEDVVYFRGPLTWKWLTSDKVEFVFFYDPQKDKISHVRLQNELILNYETIQKGETTDTLLTVDESDLYRPAHFWFEVNIPSLLKYHRRWAKNEKIKFEVIENNILKTCDRFNKDKKGFIEMLSLWARRKTKKTANAHKKISDNNKTENQKSDTPED